MNIKDLKPVSTLAANYGVKMVVYGGPGVGKTPIISTAPRPIMLVHEPGMLSMRTFKNIPAFEGYTVDKIDEFYDWFLGSAEAKNFDTLAIDSISEFAEIVLKHETKTNKDGRKVYGELSRKVMQRMSELYHLRGKHIYLIAKQTEIEDSLPPTIVNGKMIPGTTIKRKRPYFPGQDLNVKVPHLYDLFLHVNRVQFPGLVEPIACFRTKETVEIFARDRSGVLDEFEPTDLKHIFNKIAAKL